MRSWRPASPPTGTGNWPRSSFFHDQGGSSETAHILALLAAADRRRHVMEVINPALERGTVVLCDRYVHATFGVFVHRGVDFRFLATINNGIPRPDHAFYLKLPTDELLRRLRERDGDRPHVPNETETGRAGRGRFSAFRDESHNL
ncbi:hypothetical protein K4749_09500 [Streptomyces sp. TRM72054]|uniref:dTMP kinase n=1 Tax=Streptomyces sp. TRM72054 TaxID=2870562 RepID=UPI001C8C85FF|nr:hypothetical protein [Streptomyces sp. TRM72054]MBX9393823.1 hypothetical protein [Streptomyces sp. TRM72054]